MLELRCSPKRREDDFLVVLEVEVEYKEEEEDDKLVIWEVLRSRWNSRRKENDEQEILGLLEVEVEFKEDEQVVLSVGGRGGVQGGRSRMNRSICECVGGRGGVQGGEGGGGGAGGGGGRGGTPFGCV